MHDVTLINYFNHPLYLKHIAQNCPIILANGQSFLCDSVLATPLCPGTIATCVCGTTPGLLMAKWSFQRLQPCPLRFNLIMLTQVAPCSAYTSTGTCGAYLTAANRDPAIFASACNSSVLTVTADPSINGLEIMCQNPITGSTIGNASVAVICKLLKCQLITSVPPAAMSAPPGGTVTSQASMVCTNSLVLQWTPPSGTHTSYTIRITNSTSGSTLSTLSVARDVTMTTVGDLIDGSNYTVSVTAINCAGSSNSSSVSVQTCE